MVVESMHSIRILGRIVFRLLDVIFLGVEELFYSIFSPYAAFHFYAGHFEISLPARGFEKSPASVVLCPDFVYCM
jgi:hypothetical protein